MDEARIIAGLEHCLETHGRDLEPRELDLCRRVFQPPLDRYRSRLLAIGFSGLDRVLDACCGFGQWALVLADMNRQVDGCDISPVRAAVVNDLARELGVDNLAARPCSLTGLGYADDQFDAAFCYVSLNCTPWKESLRELYRVLKPGGRAYFTSNGLGYQVRQWVDEPNKIEDRSPKHYCALALQNTLNYLEHGTPPAKGQIIVEKDEMRAELRDIGFTIVALESEGCIDVTNGAHPPKPFFPGEYHGLTCCYEALVEK